MNNNNINMTDYRFDSIVKIVDCNGKTFGFNTEDTEVLESNSLVFLSEPFYNRLLARAINGYTPRQMVGIAIITSGLSIIAASAYIGAIASDAVKKANKEKAAAVKECSRLRDQIIRMSNFISKKFDTDEEEDIYNI